MKLSESEREAVVLFAWWAALNPDIALARQDETACERVFLAYRKTCRAAAREALREAAARAIADLDAEQAVP